MAKICQDIISKNKITDFINQIENIGYKQIIKSTTKATETSIITKDKFFEFVNTFTDERLGESDIELLQECV